jgi:hypothetical protein
VGKGSDDEGEDGLGALAQTAEAERLAAAELGREAAFGGEDREGEGAGYRVLAG